VYLANQACITPHVWLSRVDRPENPDRLVFDLDPPDGSDFVPVRDAAIWVRKLLEELSLPSFPMTTGSRGLHVVVPLDRSAGFDSVRSFARRVADVLEERYPGNLTTEHRKERRGARIFLDLLRNAYAQTTPAPYSVRAKKGAPVATPLEWDELSDASLTATRYNLRNIFRRLGQKNDPWSEIPYRGYSLRDAGRALEHLTSGGGGGG
jgi:bifunctional non-homologous end joining protein LigD